MTTVDIRDFTTEADATAFAAKVGGKTTEAQIEHRDYTWPDGRIEPVWRVRVVVPE